ncbi:MAG: hypothetical protein BMS9Abin28_1944 [Anaerolineae bacterium]|nr:MAG: hypothetical protein BMS9Abin28_1944 [Anaerolineae bacterium]
MREHSKRCNLRRMTRFVMLYIAASLMAACGGGAAPQESTNEGCACFWLQQFTSEAVVGEPAQKAGAGGAPLGRLVGPYDRLAALVQALHASRITG